MISQFCARGSRPAYNSVLLKPNYVQQGILIGFYVPVESKGQLLDKLLTSVYHNCKHVNIFS